MQSRVCYFSKQMQQLPRLLGWSQEREIQTRSLVRVAGMQMPDARGICTSRSWHWGLEIRTLWRGTSRCPQQHPNCITSKSHNTHFPWHFRKIVYCHLFERQSAERKRAVFILFHSQNACSNQGWSRPKLGTGSPCMCHPHERQGFRYWSSHVLPLRMHFPAV